MATPSHFCSGATAAVADARCNRSGCCKCQLDTLRLVAADRGVEVLAWSLALPLCWGNGGEIYSSPSMGNAHDAGHVQPRRKLWLSLVFDQLTCL